MKINFWDKKKFLLMHKKFFTHKAELFVLLQQKTLKISNFRAKYALLFGFKA